VPDRGLLLAIDIGNTQVVVGVVRDSTILALWRLTSQAGRTADELIPLLEPLLRPYLESLRKSRRVAVASVVPALTSAYEEYCRGTLGARPVLVDARQPLGIRISVPEPTSVGADRIANAVAVAEYYPLPAIVVDLGTATTFDVVLPGPRYVGGVIAPGILTSAEELFRRGARLAKVELRPPARAIGRTTEESVQSGVLFGAAGQIDGIIGRIRREMKGRPTVVATGGLATVIAPLCRSLRLVDPALTLRGLALIETRVRERRRGRRKSA
jgi:type III pantothenate kinase